MLMRIAGLWRMLALAAIVGVSWPTGAMAQGQESGATTRQGVIEEEQAKKEPTLHPYTVNTAERIMNKVQDALTGSTQKFHPWFESAYSGGGFTLGLGYAQFVSAYNTLDVRASYTIKQYKRVEAEFHAPRLFNRRGKLTVLGGWREATEVGFYGFGTNTSVDDRANYAFQQPYGSALLTIEPTRRYLEFIGGVELTQWKQEPGQGSAPSIDDVYAPGFLPGQNAKINYLHTQGGIALDGRTSPGYSRRGAYLGVTLHDYQDSDDRYGFQMMNYEGIGYLPILRETWVIALHGRVQTADEKNGQLIPFFMLPALGGGSSLRGYSSWRFRDKNSLLLQAEWRIPASRYFDTAFFYDAGKVTERTSDLDFDGLKTNWGVGFRFHSPFATPLRIEFAKSKEGRQFIFSSSASF
jgi:outer membrane protein assembly factor BamA